MEMDLPLPCVCQNTPKTALAVLDLPQGRHGISHPKILVVLGHNLDYPAPDFHEQEEVLQDVQKPDWLASPPENGFKGDDSFFPLAVDFFPVIEMAPVGCDAPNLGLASIGEDDEGVEPEELRDGVLVVCQISGEGCLNLFVGRLEFHEKERDAVDKSHEVGPPLIHFPHEPKLGNKEKVIVGVVVPVHQSDSFYLLSTSFRVGNMDFDPVPQKLIYLPIGGRHTEPRTITGQFLKSKVICFGRKVGVQALESNTEAGLEDDFGLIVPAKRAGRAKGFMQGIDMIPSQFLKHFDGGLFDEFLLGI